MKTLLSFLLLILSVTYSFAQSLSALAPTPNWAQLEKYQHTITQKQFVDLLDNIYVTDHRWRKWITVTSDNAHIKTHPDCPPFVLHFARNQQAIRPIPHTWKSRRVSSNTSKPLAGLNITLDPGHLGGKWAIMEERYFPVAKGIPIKEGDMALKVAKILTPRLQALGATVSLTRSQAGPTTSYRPKNLRSLAISELRMKEMPVTAYTIKKKSEELFYRTAEIRNRARLINKNFHPDIVLCLHFNAEDWGKHFELTTKNHLHLLVAGALSEEEFSKEDQRFDILLKLLSRTFTEEIPLANRLAKSLVHHTELPPYCYRSTNAIRMSSYVWARNLLATRLFQCPVVFIEAYVMNNLKVVTRVQAGDYLGLKRLQGMPPKKSIYWEYADGIADGLVQYYSQMLPKNG